MVADCKGSIVSGDDVSEALIDALFGSQAVICRWFEDGRTETELTRIRDGYWGWHEEPRNRNVSGVLLLPDPDLWKLRDERWQPLIAHNPFATNSLPDELLPLPGYIYSSDVDEFRRIEGTFLADILRLPSEWPPED